MSKGKQNLTLVDIQLKMKGVSLMWFFSLNWVMIFDLVALIGGIIMGVCLVSPREPEMYGGRRRY